MTRNTLSGTILLLTAGLLLLGGCNMFDELAVSNVDLKKIEDGSYAGQYEYEDINYRVWTKVKAGEIRDVVIFDAPSTPAGEKAKGVITRVKADQKLTVEPVQGAETESKVLLKAIEVSLKQD